MAQIENDNPAFRFTIELRLGLEFRNPAANQSELTAREILQAQFDKKTFDWLQTKSNFEILAELIGHGINLKPLRPGT